MYSMMWLLFIVMVLFLGSYVFKDTYKVKWKPLFDGWVLVVRIYKVKNQLRAKLIMGSDVVVYYVFYVCGV